jgi:hypothetical protein
MKNPKFQIPISGKISNFKFQPFVSPDLALGRWNLLGTWNLELGTVLACAACYGKSDSALAQGMNWGIFTLMGVILTVLTGIVLFFVHIVRKEEAATNPPPTDRPAEL